MKEPTLRQILLHYINSTEGFITKGQLGLITETAGYLPESCGRHLRLLAEENKIQVDYYKGKRNQKLARYARLGESKPLPVKPKIELIEVNGKMIARMI